MIEPEFREFSGLDAVRRLAEEAGSWPEAAEDWQWCARFGYQVIERRGTGGGAFRLMYSRFLEEAGTARGAAGGRGRGALDRARRRLPRRQRERRSRAAPLAGGRRGRPRRLRGRGAALDLARGGLTVETMADRGFRRIAAGTGPMTIAAAIFLIAVGAILRYATNVHVQGVSVDTVGLILMIAGAAG